MKKKLNFKLIDLIKRNITDNKTKSVQDIAQTITKEQADNCCKDQEKAEDTIKGDSITKGNEQEPIVVSACRAVRKNIYAVLYVFGVVCLIFGILYWFGGLYPEEWEENQLLTFFPNTPKFFVLPINFAWNRLNSVVDIDSNGKFGIQLITIAFTFVYFAEPKLNIFKYQVFKSMYSVSKMIVVIVFIWGCLMQVIGTSETESGILYYGIAFAISYFVGRILGKVMRRFISLLEEIFFHRK